METVVWEHLDRSDGSGPEVSYLALRKDSGGLHPRLRAHLVFVNRAFWWFGVVADGVVLFRGKCARSLWLQIPYLCVRVDMKKQGSNCSRCRIYSD